MPVIPICQPESPNVTCTAETIAPQPLSCTRVGTTYSGLYDRLVYINTLSATITWRLCDVSQVTYESEPPKVVCTTSWHLPWIQGERTVREVNDHVKARPYSGGAQSPRCRNISYNSISSTPHLSLTTYSPDLPERPWHQSITNTITIIITTIFDMAFQL